MFAMEVWISINREGGGVGRVQFNMVKLLMFRYHSTPPL
jgi:hypothetical protein